MIDDNTRIEYQSEYSEEEPTVVALVDAVATVQDTDPLDLPPLGETISADALETLIEKGNDVTITFSYEGLQITVNDGDEIVICESE
ncbi:hypothetical protein CV102_17830 [Natronococcus pandeyae]|uniref:Halobacterial output domain-containing protein n=1 Tax=Natronococcus pandeyae TaxID=2055836 RepID=A0A8J8Q4S4_9EURY|nr:HalOD1 output domain-containing protein [Natronococcus pandeyae]TYL37185.1 hypothetical protein CV102_17830 [Natronococcus pandeyae]